MAVRDRNLFAWQAYVITMSFVSVGLLLGMFFLWRSHSDLSKRYDDQADRLNTAQTEFQTSEGRVDRLLSMMGYGENTEADLQQMAEQFKDDERLSQVETDFSELMKLFPPGQPTNEKNLVKLPKFLIETIRLRNEQIDSARERQQALQQEWTQTREAERKAREDAEAKQKAAETALATARQEHAAERARLNTEKEEVLQQYAAYKQSFDQQLASLSQDNSRLNQQSSEQAETIQVQMDIINEFRDPDFASPQGEIIRVSDGGTTVWVNLGSDDGLRVGVPFSVIDESEVRISEARTKADVVITEVVGPHLSRARASDFDFRNTIVTGDKIYSPAWRPGRTTGFALVGMMDMNDDRRDDSEQVRELIRISGGQIDEEMDTNGSRNGPGMTPNTSFIVLGTDLSLPANASPELQEQQKARAKNYAEFINEARRKGIIEISLDKLMGYLKSEGSNRTIPLGGQIRADDFPIRPDYTPPSSRGSVSEIFMKRQPKP